MSTVSDREHLRLLSIFHYVLAGLVALCALFPVIHLVLGIAIVSGGLDDGRRNDPPEAIGWIFIAVALLLMALGFALAIAVVIAGNRLRQHRSYTYCLVIAAILCMFMPLGTALGVFTIVVLVRESVKALFAERAAAVRPV